MQEMYFTKPAPKQIVGNIESAPSADGPWEVVREIKALCPYHFDLKVANIVERESSDGYYLRGVVTGENIVAL